MYFVGELFNVFFLFGLMILVGLFVDNLVVVVENIYCFYCEENVLCCEVVICGVGEIVMVIMMVMLMMVIVFLLVLFVDGQGQFFLLCLVILICVLFIVLFFVVLIFVLLSVYFMLFKGDEDESGVFVCLKLWFKVGMFWFYEQMFGWLSIFYGKLLGYVLCCCFDFVLGLFVLLGVILVVLNQVEFVVMFEDEQVFFEIGVELLCSMIFEESEVYFCNVEMKVVEVVEEVGFDFYMIFYWCNFGEVQGVFLVDCVDIFLCEVLQKIFEVFLELLGIEFDIGQDFEQESDDKNFECFCFYGEDVVQFDEIVEDFEDVFVQLFGVMGVKKVIECVFNEFVFVIDCVWVQ